MWVGALAYRNSFLRAPAQNIHIYIIIYIANSPPAASYGARRGHTPLAEPKSLPPDAFSNENAVAALVQASPYTHATATPVNVVPARLQPTQQ